MRLVKLEALLVEIGGDITALVPPLAALLGIPTDGRYPAVEASPQRLKEQTFEALLAYIEAIAARRPALLVFEDLHWIDPTSLELIGLLVGRLSTLPMLATLTARPELEPSWTAGSQITRLLLDRLRPPEAAALAQAASGKGLPPDPLDQIVVRADGVPLFVEELTRAILEAGVVDDAGDGYVLDASLRSVAIPATLQDSLMAHLDRLGPAKKVAQQKCRKVGRQPFTSPADPFQSGAGAALSCFWRLEARSTASGTHALRASPQFAFCQGLMLPESVASPQKVFMTVEPK